MRAPVSVSACFARRHVRRAPLVAALFACHVGAALAQQASTLQAITVTGETYTEYKPENTRSATRTDTPIKEIPQSISVIPKEVLEDIGDTEVLNTLELGGVVKGHQYGGGMDVFSLRGFRTGTYYRNGMPSAGFGAMDASGVESVDILRGPSSLTLGQGDPGGSFNIVSKQPLREAAYGVSAGVDEHGGWRTTADLTGPLNSSKTLLYRINMAVSGGDTYRDHVSKNRDYFAPRISWQLAPQTKVLLDVSWMRVRQPHDRGIPINANLLYGPPPISFFSSDPNAGRLRNKNTTGQLRVEHAFSDNWHLDAGIQRVVGALDGWGIQLANLQADQRTFTRQLTWRSTHRSSDLAQAYLRGKLMLGGMEHNILTGVEYRNSKSRVHNPPATGVPNIDAYNPVYGLPLPFNTVTINPGMPTLTHVRAFTLQDQIKITSALSVLAGFRYDDYEQRNVTSWRGNDTVTPRVGATYAFTDDLSGYLSYSRSFKPNNGLDVNGNTFDPEQGVSWEAGIKTDLFDRRMGLTASVFRTVKNNVTTPHPTLIGVSVLTGQQRSEGVDVSLSGKIGAHTRVIAYAAVMDAVITRNNSITSPPGTRLHDIPRKQFKLTTLHDLAGTLKGAEVGATLNYVGERTTSINATQALKMPAYTVMDMMMNYQVNPQTKLRFQLRNVFDRVHYTNSANGATNVFSGEPRTAYATLEYKF